MNYSSVASGHEYTTFNLISSYISFNLFYVFSNILMLNLATRREIYYVTRYMYVKHKYIHGLMRAGVCVVHLNTINTVTQTKGAKIRNEVKYLGKTVNWPFSARNYQSIEIRMEHI